MSLRLLVKQPGTAPGSEHLESFLRPPLKWAGGKRWLVPYLRGIWSSHSHRRLVEPFCGGLAVTLGLRPAVGSQNDANPHLINFYQWLRAGFETSIPFENTEKRFYQYRARFNDLVADGRVDCADAAALFYYLNRTCYNGLCRFNRNGFFNVPFGKYKHVSYDLDFVKYQSALKTCEFTAGDFERVHIERGDFIYADPPYDVTFTHYSRGGFGWSDQIRLAAWLGAHKGPIVLSNQATPRIVDLYKKHGFQLSFRDAPRMISCNGDRRKAREVLAFKNL